MLEESRIFHVETAGLPASFHSFKFCQTAEMSPPVPPLPEMIVQLDIGPHSTAEKENIFANAVQTLVSDAPVQIKPILDKLGHPSEDEGG